MRENQVTEINFVKLTFLYSLLIKTYSYIKKFLAQIN